MLNLTRKLDQSVTIQTSDGPITVMVTRIDRGQVGIGIDAPKQCHISRTDTLPPGWGYGEAQDGIKI